MAVCGVHYLPFIIIITFLRALIYRRGHITAGPRLGLVLQALPSSASRPAVLPPFLTLSRPGRNAPLREPELLRRGRTRSWSPFRVPSRRTGPPGRPSGSASRAGPRTAPKWLTAALRRHGPRPPSGRTDWPAGRRRRPMATGSGGGRANGGRRGAGAGAGAAGARLNGEYKEARAGAGRCRACQRRAVQCCPQPRAPLRSSERRRLFAFFPFLSARFSRSPVFLEEALPPPADAQRRSGGGRVHERRGCRPPCRVAGAPPPLGGEARARPAPGSPPAAPRAPPAGDAPSSAGRRGPASLSLRALPAAARPAGRPLPPTAPCPAPRGGCGPARRAAMRLPRRARSPCGRRGAVEGARP